VRTAGHCTGFSLIFWNRFVVRASTLRNQPPLKVSAVGLYSTCFTWPAVPARISCPFS
jgi:hypothetical protein